jgi:hypothetical protein
MPSYDDIRPQDVYRETGRWFGPVAVALAAAFVIIAGLTVAGWQLGWWFASHNATRQAEVTQNGYSNQTTLRSQVTEKLGEVASMTTQIDSAASAQQAADLKAQRAAIAGIACSDAAQITGTPLPAQQAAWVSLNCSDGSVSPSSSLFVTGAP